MAWLHALWLAYRQHKDPEAGLSGLFVWHRDFRTHAVAAIRAPKGQTSAGVLTGWRTIRSLPALGS